MTFRLDTTTTEKNDMPPPPRLLRIGDASGSEEELGLADEDGWPLEDVRVCTPKGVLFKGIRYAHSALGAHVDQLVRVETLGPDAEGNPPAAARLYDIGGNLICTALRGRAWSSISHRSSDR